MQMCPPEANVSSPEVDVSTPEADVSSPARLGARFGARLGARFGARLGARSVLIRIDPYRSVSIRSDGPSDDPGDGPSDDPSDATALRCAVKRTLEPLRQNNITSHLLLYVSTIDYYSSCTLFIWPYLGSRCEVIPE